MSKNDLASGNANEFAISRALSSSRQILKDRFCERVERRLTMGRTLLSDGSYMASLCRQTVLCLQESVSFVQRTMFLSGAGCLRLIRVRARADAIITRSVDGHGTPAKHSSNGTPTDAGLSAAALDGSYLRHGIGDGDVFGICTIAASDAGSVIATLCCNAACTRNGQRVILRISIHKVYLDGGFIGCSRHGIVTHKDNGCIAAAIDTAVSDIHSVEHRCLTCRDGGGRCACNHEVRNNYGYGAGGCHAAAVVGRGGDGGCACTYGGH